MTVASGTILAQIVTVIFSPFITRLYGPEAFGTLGVFIAFTALLSSIISFTYPMAIILPKEETVAVAVAKISLYIGGVFSIIIGIGLWIFGEPILNHFNMNVLLNYLIFIPIFLFLSAALQVTNQWIIREKLFRIYSKATLQQSVLLNFSKIGIGLLSPTSFSLVLLTTVGQLLSILLLLKGTSKKLISNLKKKTNAALLKKTAKLYLDFPKYRAPEMFINGITQNFPLLLLTSAFGPASAGFYLLGQRMLSLPSQLLGKAIGDVFYPRVAEAVNNKENITRLISKATAALVVVGIMPFGLIFILGPFIFGWIFGEEWRVAGEYARWLSLWSFFVFINNPSVRTLPVIFEQKFLLSFTNVGLVIRLGMLLIGIHYFGNDILSIILYSVSGALLNIYLIISVMRKTKKYDYKISRI
nr:oligosaccharide flippase family protein [Planomicrobium sp. YIM 101495]